MNRVYGINEINYKQTCIHELHRIFGHKNIQSLKKMINENMVTGINLKNCNCNLECKVCIESKMTRKSFNKSKPKVTKQVLEIIDTDICGPMSTLTHRQKRYILTLIDDYSRFTYIYLLNKASEARQKIIQFVELMKTQYGKKPKKFHSDRGGEYLN